MDYIKSQVITKQSEQQMMRKTVREVTASVESARRFLQSTGIMTSKGNLSPKYK